MRKRPIEDTVEDVEFMLEHGESPVNIPARLGYTSIPSLQRVLQRTGRNDLAMRLTEHQDSSGNEEWKRTARRLEAWLVEHETGPRDRIVS